MQRLARSPALILRSQVLRSAQPFLPAMSQIAPMATTSQQAPFVISTTPEKGSGIWKAHHLTSYALAAAIPTNFLLGPYIPLDVVIGLVIPYHAHIGLSVIINDYIYGSARPLAKYALYFITGVTTLGLLKINLFDVGITAGIKSLWLKEEKH